MLPMLVISTIVVAPVPPVLRHLPHCQVLVVEEVVVRYGGDVTRQVHVAQVELGLPLVQLRGRKVVVGRVRDETPVLHQEFPVGQVGLPQVDEDVLVRQRHAEDVRVHGPQDRHGLPRDVGRAHTSHRCLLVVISRPEAAGSRRRRRPPAPAATRSWVASSKWRPTTCTARGSPSPLVPNGTDMAGEPVRSNGTNALRAFLGGALMPSTSSSDALHGWAGTTLAGQRRMSYSEK